LKEGKQPKTTGSNRITDRSKAVAVAENR